MLPGIDVRVGTDIQAVDEIEDSLQRYGSRYTDRLFTAHEVATCAGPSAAARLSARFAAKEAVLKLLAPTDVIPRWRSIEVRTGANGAPSIELTDEAADLARERGVQGLSLSMTHGAGLAAATVVALAITDPGSTPDDAFDVELPDAMLRRSTFESISAMRRSLVQLGADGLAPEGARS